MLLENLLGSGQQLSQRVCNQWNHKMHSFSNLPTRSEGLMVCNRPCILSHECDQQAANILLWYQRKCADALLAVNRGNLPETHRQLRTQVRARRVLRKTSPLRLETLRRSWLSGKQLMERRNTMSSSKVKHAMCSNIASVIANRVIQECCREVPPPCWFAGHAAACQETACQL